MFTVFTSMTISLNIAISEPLTQKEYSFLGNIEHPDLFEASGLAYSTLNQGVIWSHNDSGNAPVIYAMSTNGQNTACFTLEDSGCLDWEDIASFSKNKIPYLLISDTGDNLGIRDLNYLNIVREPLLNKTPESINQKPFIDDEKCSKSLKPEKIIKFRYPDGSHDCEAVAVDTASDSAFLVSKREMPPVLYEVPLSSSGNEAITAKKIGIINLSSSDSTDNEKIKLGKKSLRVTAMDISRDCMSMVLLTYTDAYLFKRTSLKESWRSVVSRPAQKIRLFSNTDKRLPQREAVCFEPDASAIIVTTEIKPSGIFRFPVK